MKKVLIIVRGIPGSGKTSFASFLGKAICCADDYYVHDGEYKWKAEDIGKAHGWSQRKCRRFMKAQVETVIIANTNTTEREMQPYMDLARQFGYMVYSIIVENRHGNESVHGVPEATLEKMRGRFDVKL
jgi:predicted kinase